MENSETLLTFISKAERIGVIGSPSSTSELTLDILGTAVTKKLVGELCLFNYPQDGANHYAMGQITEVELRNVWMEDATMRSIVRQKGQIDPISERQDTHIGKMKLSAIFKDGVDHYEPSILGTVPSTGTPIHLVDDQIIHTLLQQYQRELYYLGYVYGSKPKLPLWFKHFDSGYGGAGEAYHLGIFGKTGSGKSVLAKMIMLGYARHPNMAIFVLDPQGEFSKDLKGDVPDTGFPLNLNKQMGYLSRPVRVVDVQSLILDRWDLFEEILYESPFFEQLTMPAGENRRLACENLSRELKRSKIKLADLSKRVSFDSVWSILHQEDVQRRFYRSKDSRERFIQAIVDADPDQFYEDFWRPVTMLFNQNRKNAITVDYLLRQVFDIERQERPVVVINLSAEGVRGIYWNETIKLLIIRRFLDALVYQAERYYKGNKSLNTLVIVDEAHRLAPRERIEDESLNIVKSRFIDAVRTTRKYGLGWMFISQTLSSLHREILQQIRIFFFGFGLALGTEFMALRELIGGNQTALNLYQTFRDPHSSFDPRSREYPFMTVGPVSPLSFSGTPLFLTAFNTPRRFLEENNFEQNQA